MLLRMVVDIGSFFSVCFVDDTEFFPPNPGRLLCCAFQANGSIRKRGCRMQPVKHIMAPAYSRKQFLIKLFNDAARFISAVRDDPATGPAVTEKTSRMELAGGELCPSLVKAEAERLEVDPEAFDPEILRTTLYEALGRRCRDQGGKGPGNATH